MTSTLSSATFRSADEELIDALTTADAKRPPRISPGETLLTRLLVVLSSPMWLAATGFVMLARLVRGRLPLLVLHDRVGFGRTRLCVPKIATASVVSNDRRLGGLIQVATGAPVDLAVEHPFEEWLRHSGVDELPQLALVALGSMRIVGPRPVTPEELAEMAPPDAEVAVDVLQPGLVGLWQVLDRHAYLLPARHDLDMLMINNWSRHFQRSIIAEAIRQTLRRARGSGLSS